MARRIRKTDREKGKLQEYTESLLIAVIAALIIRTFFIQAFKIPTGSMEDTLLVGDFLLVNKFKYGAKIPFTDWRLPEFSEPKSGDIVVFRYPRNPSLDYIKRCVAAGGQTVEIRNKVVYVDGNPFPDPPEAKFNASVLEKGIPDQRIYPHGSSFNSDNYGPIKVPEGHFFMMGDNRDNSEDSRYWGFVPRDNIIGEPVIIYWSWERNIPLYKFFSKVRWSRIAHLIE